MAQEINEHRFGELERRVGGIEDSVSTIKDNHLAHMEVDMASTKTNVDWLLRYHWITASASIGAVITGIITLLRTNPHT